MSALVALLLTFVLPAMAGGVLLASPSREPAEDPATADGADIILARALACGIAAWLLGSGLLTRTVGLTGTASWVWGAVVAAASLVVLVLPSNRVRLRRALVPAGRRLAQAGGITALVFVPLAYAIVHTSWSPLGSTPWYYYGLAQQVADVGEIPKTSIEFATSTTFLNDYHLFTTGTAMLLTQQPDGPISVITIVTLLGVLLLGVGMVALATSLGAGRLTALLAAPLAVATGIGPGRLAAYRPEGFALGLTVLLVALSIDWLRRKDWRSLAPAALLAATLSQVHGIAALTAGVLVASAAVVFLVRGDRREQLKRSGLALVALVGAVIVTGVVFREASGTTHAGGLVDRGGLADPTWAFFRAARDEPHDLPQSNGDMIADALRELYRWSWWWFVPLLLLAIAGHVRRRRDPATQNTVGFTLLSLVGIAAVASIFMFGWQGYVPRRTGASRLILEMSLLVPPFVAVGVSGLIRDMTGWRRRLLPSEQWRSFTVLAAASVLGMVSLVRLAEYDIGLAPGRDELAVWQSLPLTSDDVVLANGYTEGFIPDVTGAQGLLDGRAPYTFASLLDRANNLLRGAQTFFADPATHWDYITQNHVTWIVVADDDSNALGTANIWPTPPNVDELDSCAGLERVAGISTLTVFRVVEPTTGCSSLE
jgi:hypothetical protein